MLFFSKTYGLDNFSPKTFESEKQCICMNCFPDFWGLVSVCECCCQRWSWYLAKHGWIQHSSENTWQLVPFSQQVALYSAKIFTCDFYCIFLQHFAQKSAFRLQKPIYDPSFNIIYSYVSPIQINSYIKLEEIILGCL